MVAAANPLAVAAGVKILREGGSAIDAAIAVQAVLGLVEPQSSGLGGGAFMVYYDARTRKVISYNGRETAPAGAGPGLFLDDAGKPLPFRTAVVSGRATGVPGAVAMLAKAHDQHGVLPWSRCSATPKRWRPTASPSARDWRPSSPTRRRSPPSRTWSPISPRRTGRRSRPATS